ncbi:hypothetical protein P9D34_12550 [Bacillus swezeyi]|uniref:Uncharacterized protein n=1 Tax=Bacillus swezeyi TaxID=1925020 RepID=A0A1R1RMR3_9BACI|nr:hypothetical protein [Bacillus swezeyi]MEC1261275.1 hypothetical protein [Bacillus swezeyi]MED2929254.1 hypothetical protein [Bacillus swezeyi]MED2963719.1 hypothetical protein [Bacillus swezeyi]MED3073575.1 hypothetical protein [Bacillus swezeyi]MED3081835.1 hypothetical protein [Bacillus swezeyi]
MSIEMEFPTLLINHLIDKGAKEEITVVKEKSLNRTLFTYLGKKYDMPDLADFANKSETEEYLEGWFNTYNGSDYKRKFNVENNGLNLLVAALIFS